MFSPSENHGLLVTQVKGYGMKGKKIATYGPK